jgi:hypothetical protein
MDARPTVPLEYRGKGEIPLSDPNVGKKFACGFFGGIGVSTAAYFIGGAFDPVAILFIGVAIGFLKAIVGIVFVCFRLRRPIGLGILVSLPVGIGIFLGACAAYVHHI